MEGDRKVWGKEREMGDEEMQDRGGLLREGRGCVEKGDGLREGGGGEKGGMKTVGKECDGEGK